MIENHNWSKVLTGIPTRNVWSGHVLNHRLDSGEFIKQVLMKTGNWNGIKNLSKIVSWLKWMGGEKMEK